MPPLTNAPQSPAGFYAPPTTWQGSFQANAANNATGGYFDPTDYGLQQTAINYGQAALNSAGAPGPQMQAAQVGPLQQAQAAQLDPTLYNQDRTQQTGLQAYLQGVAGGSIPSQAAATMRAGLQQNQAQQAGLSAGQTQNAGATLRDNAMSNGQANQAMVGQAQMAQLQEQRAAQGQLAGLNSQIAGQDLGVAGQNAQYKQQAGLANAGFQNQAAMANAQYQQGANIANQGANLNQANLNQQNAQYWQNLIEQQNQDLKQAQEVAKQQKQKSDQQDMQTDEAIASGGASGLASLSDERAKTAIEPGDDELDLFLSPLGAHSYEYKDKAHGEDRYVSPMAQELAKSTLGASMVKRRPDGLLEVDYGRGLGTMLSATANNHRRLNAIEEMLRGRS